MAQSSLDAASPIGRLTSNGPHSAQRYGYVGKVASGRFTC
jgi:hypothetical protein